MDILFIATISCCALILCTLIVHIIHSRKIINHISALQYGLDNQQQQHQFVLTEIQKSREALIEQFHKLSSNLDKSLSNYQTEHQKAQQDFQQSHHSAQLQHLNTLQDTLRKTSMDIRQQLIDTLNQHTKTLDKGMDKLTQNTGQRLTEISKQVDQRLTEGFEKTTATFTDVLKRLAIIDEAQKKITELSTNVVSLQEILSDKRSRGAFGEVQLNALISNMLPENNYDFQASLSNGKRVDCLLYLPEPTGNVAIDAKFPLENYRIMTDIHSSDGDRQAAEQQFKKDIKHHIDGIAEKYIIPGETADGAVMFIPAEAIFAEIHGHHPDIVEYAHRQRIWLVSPTTMMAIVTTARAVLKDEATRKQVHIIQEHLRFLAKDFQRFEKRMDNLARHIDMAHHDIQDVNTSAKKITSRFGKIEQVDVASLEENVLPEIECEDE